MGSIETTTPAVATATTPAAKQWSISNPFRDAIIAGEVCPVFTTRMTCSAELPMVLKMAGAKALFIDMEHSAFDFHMVAQQIMACNYAGVSAIVRIPSKSHWHISRMLDSGAAAIVVPHVETIEEVKDLVKHAKYAPIGARGCSNMQPLFNFGLVPTKIQNETLNRETMLIPMIETPDAVDLVDKFLAVEGVDGIMIGSNDLCSDMGIPGQYDDPQYQDAITKIVLAGKKAGKPIGIGGIGGRLDLLEKWFNMGATWSLSGGDLAALRAAIHKIGENYSAINERVQQHKAASS